MAELNYEQKKAAATQLAVMELGAALEGYRSLAVDLSGFSVRGPRFQGDEIMVVVRGIDGDGLPVVAFHSAFGLEEALLGVSSRLRNGSLKWRPDEFAK